MRYVCLFLALALATLGQSTRELYIYDPSGNRTRGPEVDVRGDSRTERLQSINGRSVPLEQVEERVVREDGPVKVIERITKRFDQTGHLAQTEKVVEERTKLPDGNTNIRASTWRSNVNGNMNLSERSSTDVRSNGDVQTANQVIERPSINGDFVTAEKRVTVEERSPSREARNVVVYRRGDSGGLYESFKESTERQITNGRSVENGARYAVGTSGRLELYEQTVTTAVNRPDGTESVVTDVYTAEPPGIATTVGDAPKLKQEQVIERRRSEGEVDEVLSIRETSLADPNRLGPPRKIRETVCRGKCLE